MDAKDLRAEAALTERSNDGGAKFALQYDRSKSHDAGASAFKGDTAGARPCAVIGPDRVVPPPRDVPKKAPAEPWLAPDSIYRRLPDYPYKMPDHKDPARNISPRQTFQENMQRIIMPPGYNATKLHEDPVFASKNTKLNMPTEVKYCEVPYNINQVSSDQKHIRNVDHSASSVNPLLMRGVPHGWPAGSVHVRPLRPYGAPEVLPYPDYANCGGPRPVLSRPSTHEEPLYPDSYYHENNVRFKPYPNIKDRYPQNRYEYLGNYPNPYHPPNPFAHKYELPKTMPPHPYSGYPQIPKYSERIPEPIMDGYQRALSQQGNYGVPIRSPVIHSPYRPVPGNMQNKLNPYPPDGQHKPVPNKLPYDPANKMYVDYDPRSKQGSMPMTENYYFNELPRQYHSRNIVVPNFPPAPMHGVNAHPYYVKENISLKNYEYSRYKNMDPSMINNSLTKLPPQFSPSALAISPADSNASNETAQTHGTAQEDCGYVSQSSVTSVRSMESLNRMPMDPYGRYDYRYGPIVRTSQATKPYPDPNSNQGSKSKKDIRQFISSWSEGDDENAENGVKRDGVKIISDEKNMFSKQYETVNNQEQLYVLGLVNVPSEELSKYEHIQKVSKLPENIKGYNSLELLNQFEEAIESSKITSVKPPTPRTVQIPLKSAPQKHDPIPRALSPLDVEAKISQSVIHKEVGCNFEIKPCSPKMLNVEVATPMQMLNERVIEKVANPHQMKSPIILQGVDDNLDPNLTSKTVKCHVPNTAPSCKMINSQHLSDLPNTDHLKTNYTLQDLESSSGVCLASLPRLDTDIELNFPEVNQQFINANKTESVITTSFAKDLPTLDIDKQVANTEFDINYQYSPKLETETDFSRLSKYRKIKRCAPDDKNTELVKVQATRVDSVIIKNPENIRSLEENTDSSGGNFRDDLQEFAINLVSQTKDSKQQFDVDKMFDTSTNSAISSKYDDVNINSPSSFTMHKSNNLPSKHLNVVEETSGKNSVPAQTEDLSKHGRDLSNQYLEKAMLDIPMNLSPQAKYLTIGLDEEIRHIKRNEKTAVLGEKQQLAVDNTCDQKKIHDKEYISSVHLDKPQNELITQRNASVTDLSDSQCLDTRHKWLTKKITPDSCLTANVVKDRDEMKDETNCSDLHTKNQSLHGEHQTEENTVFDIKEKVGIQGKEDLEKIIGETDDIKDVQNDKKGQNKDESSAEIANNINHTDTIGYRHTEHDTLTEKYRKRHDSVSYVPKLKRKKFRDTITHRKKSHENRIATIVDHNIEHHNEKENLEKLPTSDKECPARQLMHEPTQIIPLNLTEEENNKTQGLIGKECEDNANEETSVCDLNTDQNKNVLLSNSGTSEKITQYCKDVKTDVLLLNSPVTDKCFENILVSEMTTSLQKGLPSDIDTDIKNIENSDLAVNPNLSSDALLESTKIVNDDIPDKDMSVDQIEPSLNQPNVSINYEAKELNLPSYSHIDLKLDNENLDKLVTLKTEQEEIYLKYQETKTDSDIISHKEEGSRQPIADLCYELSSEYNKDINTVSENEGPNTPLQKNKNEELQNCQDFKTTLLKNEELHLVVELSNDSNNHLDCKSKNNNNISPDGTHTQKFIKNDPVCRAFLNKELFSSRFQNLLFYNVNFDICSDDVHSKIVNTQLTLKYNGHDTMDNHPNMCLTNKDIANTVECVNELGCDNDMDKDLDSHPQIETMDKASMSEERNDENLDEEKFTLINDNTNSDSKHVEIDHMQCNQDEKEKEINTTSVETIVKFSKNQLITDASSFPKLTTDISDSESLCQKLNNVSDRDLKHNNGQSESYLPLSNNDSCVKSNNPGYEPCSQDDECVKNLEKDKSECEPDLQSMNTVESEACGTNVIVIDDTIDVSLQNYDENSEIATPPEWELNNKIQSVVDNSSARPRFPLKRSLSDSALSSYYDDVDECSEKRCVLSKKRKKHCDIGNISESHLLNIIQSSRRNSVSTLSNENFSFCILIDDHCIVADENYEQQNFMQVEDDLSNHSLKDIPVVEEEKLSSSSSLYNLTDQYENTSDTNITKYNEEKVWIEDVGCEETIETEDIAENIVIGDPNSPKDTDITDYESDDEDEDTLNNEAADHTSKVKHIYGDNMCTNDAQLVDALYRTPQMDVNKKLMDKESHITEKSNKYYDSDSLEMLLAEPVDNMLSAVTEQNISVPMAKDTKEENSTCVDIPSPAASNLTNILPNDIIPNKENVESLNSLSETITNGNYDETLDSTIHSREPNLDNDFSHIDKRGRTLKNSSSPEVSSTTPEEKNSSILLKISSYKGSRISEVKSLSSVKQEENRCELASKEYFRHDYSHSSSTKRPLLTKAAQKYIPPLRETIPDLRVKLALPQQSLMKLQKNKVTKEEPKFSACNVYTNSNNIKLKKEIPKKIKPKFEDVLKNIDEAQYQMHKEKNKKSKKYVPKVVIKKSENGSHYASTSTKEAFNPDLTGRKWQPWVFIEKNKFVDDMALKHKTRAVFNHRRKSFVLAEKFCKYRSISTAKFVISQPKLNDCPSGNLKYTIKLTHR